MLYVSVEAGKYTRDRARLSNIETLSKSIQFYNITYGYYPQAALDSNVSILLHEEQIVYGQIRDPLFLSSTVDLNNITLSSRSLTSEISCSACFTISKFIEPSLFDGVGTDKNIMSLFSTTSLNECNDFDGSLHPCRFLIHQSLALDWVSLLLMW